MGWWVYPLWKEMGVFRTCYQLHRCFFRYFQLRRLRSRQYLLWLASLLDHSHIHLCLRMLLDTQKHNNHSFLGCLGSKVNQFQKTRFCSLSLEHFPYSTVGAGQPASLKGVSKMAIVPQLQVSCLDKKPPQPSWLSVAALPSGCSHFQRYGQSDRVWLTIFGSQHQWRYKFYGWLIVVHPVLMQR